MGGVSGRWMSLIKMSRRWRRCGITQTLISVFVRGHTTRAAHSSWQPSILLSSLSAVLPGGRCAGAALVPVWPLPSPAPLLWRRFLPVTGPSSTSRCDGSPALFFSAFLSPRSTLFFNPCSRWSFISPPTSPPMLTDVHQLVTVSTSWIASPAGFCCCCPAPPPGVHRQQ